MKNDTLHVIDNVLHLPAPIRAYLADRLLESLDVEEISEEWKAEITKRCNELDEGSVELIPAENVFRDMTRVTG